MGWESKTTSSSVPGLMFEKVLLGTETLPMPGPHCEVGLRMSVFVGPLSPRAGWQVASLTRSTAPWPPQQLAKAAEDMVLGGRAATPVGRQAASDLARQQAQQDSSPAVWEDWEPDSRATLEPDSQHFARQPSGETRQPTCLTPSGSLCRTDTVPDNIQVLSNQFYPLPWTWALNY